MDNFWLLRCSQCNSLMAASLKISVVFIVYFIFFLLLLALFPIMPNDGRFQQEDGFKLNAIVCVFVFPFFAARFISRFFVKITVIEDSSKNAEKEKE